MQAFRFFVMRLLLAADLTRLTLYFRLHRLMAAARGDKPGLSGLAGVEGAGGLGAGCWLGGGVDPVTSNDTAVAL